MTVRNLNGLNLAAALAAYTDECCYLCGGRDGETQNNGYWYLEGCHFCGDREELYVGCSFCGSRNLSRRWIDILQEVSLRMTSSGNLICTGCAYSHRWVECLICREFSQYQGEFDYCERHYEDNVSYCASCRHSYEISVGCINPWCTLSPYYESDGYEEYENCYIERYSSKITTKIGSPEDSIFLGVELEVLSTSEKGIYTFNEGRAILKSDSSILGKGFEIVTAPMSLPIQLEYWEGLIEQFGKEIAPDPSCGMHVHLSKEPLSQLQIGKILVFLNDPVNSDWIDKIAGRPANRYCSRVKKTLEDINHQNSRYEALNLLNDSTIEFRLFSSSNSIEEIMSRIEFCHSLTKYCETAELDELEWDYYMKWIYVDSPPRMYLYLKEWIEKADE